MIFMEKNVGKLKQINEEALELARQRREIRFKAKINELFNGEYGLDKVYYTDRTCKVIITCPKHGDIEVAADNLLRGVKCPLCKKEEMHEFRQRGNKKRTQEEWVQLCAERHKGKYDYGEADFKHLTEDGKVKIICHELDENGNEHGEFWQRPSQHLRGKGCPKCGNKQKTTATFCKEFKEKYGDKYDLSLVEYKGIFEHVTVICPICKHIFQITPHNMLHGRNCPNCAILRAKERYKLPTKIVQERINQVFNGKYDLSLMNYENIDTPVKVICHEVDENGNEHGVFEQIPYMLFKGHGCPKCGQSKLENTIQVFLDRNNIQSIYEYSPKWLNRQSLDFYLPEYNVAIECQGKQHFEKVNFGMTSEEEIEERFQYTIFNDKKKAKLCEENGVKLLYYSDLDIEYPYDVFEDKEKLLEEIKKYSSKNLEIKKRSDTFAA